MKTPIVLPQAIFANPNCIRNELIGSDTIIKQCLLTLINAASKKSKIYFSVHHLKDSELTSAFVKAHDRGVSVNIILDGSDAPLPGTPNQSPMYNQSAYDQLVAGEIGNVYMIKNNIMVNERYPILIHPKFALFSQVDLDGQILKNVIFSTSTNFTKNSYSKLQDALIFQDEDLYKSGFRLFWKLIRDHRDDLREYNYFSEMSSAKLGDGKTSVMKTYFFPKRKEGNKFGDDTVELILRNIDSKAGNAYVRIAMSLWSDRREEILTQLKRIATDSSSNKIEIILPKKPTNKKRMLSLKEFEDKYENVTFHNIDTNLHSKYILLDAHYTTEQKHGKQKRLFMGSQNFTKNALRRNFEVWTKVICEGGKYEKVYNAYLRNFNEIVGGVRNKEVQKTGPSAEILELV